MNEVENQVSDLIVLIFCLNFGIPRLACTCIPIIYTLPDLDKGF